MTEGREEPAQSIGRAGIVNQDGAANYGTQIGVQHVHPAQRKYPKDLTLRIPRVPQDNIIGRESDVADLHQRLFDRRQVVLVNGLGGIGKTTLAQVYVNQYYDEYAHVAWVTQVTGDFKSDLVNADGLLKSLQINSKDTEPEDLFKLAIAGLKGIEAGPNLLVVDNADRSLADYAYVLPGQPNWHVLVTSRERIERFEAKALDFLSMTEAIALFESHYTLGQLSQAEIRELIETVDRHTLTVEILAKTAQLQRSGFAQLKQALPDDLWANVYVEHRGSKIERVQSYLRSIFQFSGISADGIWLLKQLMCLPSEFHTYELLQALLVPEGSDRRENFAETLAELMERGWMLYNLASDSYKMHRVIAEVVASEYPVEVSEAEALIRELTERLSLDQTKDNPVDKFQWISFGRACLSHFERETEQAISTLQNNLALRLMDFGDYSGAKLLLEKAMASAERNFGPEHPSTARSYSNLATVLKALGEFEGAKHLLEKAMASDERNFGPEHPSTARSYSNLATVLKALGEFEGAK
ncbi:MAG: tetratricopeptide repeat protein, partial [Cyanobacteria bacterium P01_D01_bin.123]